MPTTASGIRREHVEAFAPASEATCYRSLQQFFRWLAEEGEIDASRMARMRSPIIPSNR